MEIRVFSISLSLSLSLRFGSDPDFRIETHKLLRWTINVQFAFYASIVILNLAGFSNSNNIYISMNDFIITFKAPHTPSYTKPQTTHTQSPNVHSTTILNRHSTKIRLVENLFHVLVAVFYSFFDTGDTMSMSQKMIVSPFVLIYFGVCSIKYGCHQLTKKKKLSVFGFSYEIIK